MSKIETKIKELRDDLKKNLENLEKDASDFGLEQLKNLKGVIAEAEKAIKESKEKKKVKTITISEETHNAVKKCCVANDEKISEWVETVLTEAVSSCSCSTKEEK